MLNTIACIILYVFVLILHVYTMQVYRTLIWPDMLISVYISYLAVYCEKYSRLEQAGIGFKRDRQVSWPWPLMDGSYIYS